MHHSSGRLGRSSASPRSQPLAPMSVAVLASVSSGLEDLAAAEVADCGPPGTD
jgi:hypothetical protein